MTTDTDEFRQHVLEFVLLFETFHERPPVLADLAKEFESDRELADGRVLPGRERSTIRHHVGVLEAEGLLTTDGSEVRTTRRGRQLATPFLKNWLKRR